MKVAGIIRVAGLAVIGIAILSASGCATSAVQVPGPRAVSTKAVTATPSSSIVWTSFTKSGLFSVDYPAGWTLAPPFPGEQEFGTGILVDIKASVAKSDIARWCSAHPTTTMAGLPAAEMSGVDSLSRPYHEWTAANQTIGLQFMVLTDLNSVQQGLNTFQHLDSFQSTYLHMLQSVTIPAQYQHATVCSSS